MNSNSFRETFGILDPSTKKPYSDIIGATLKTSLVTVYDLHRQFLHFKEEDYKIQCDWETFSTIAKNYQMKCVISYQRRTTGNYAIIRLYKQELVKKEI